MASKRSRGSRIKACFPTVFSDVLSSNIAPAQVKFQLYDDQFKDYVELSDEKRLEEDIKTRALVTKVTRQNRYSLIL